MMHLFKGNIGSGVFAMGDAFRNAGILTGTVVTILLGIVCLHAQRLLVGNLLKTEHTYSENIFIIKS